VTRRALAGTEASKLDARKLAPTANSSDGDTK